MNDLEYICAKCKYYENPLAGHQGLCIHSSEPNPHAYNPTGVSLLVSPDFYCKSHEFKDDILG